MEPWPLLLLGCAQRCLQRREEAKPRRLKSTRDVLGPELLPHLADARAQLAAWEKCGAANRALALQRMPADIHFAARAAQIHVAPHDRRDTSAVCAFSLVRATAAEGVEPDADDDRFLFDAVMSGERADGARFDARVVVSGGAWLWFLEAAMLACNPTAVLSKVVAAQWLDTPGALTDGQLLSMDAAPALLTHDVQLVLRDAAALFRRVLGVR